MKINQIILLLTTIDSIPRERERMRVCIWERKKKDRGGSLLRKGREGASER